MITAQNFTQEAKNNNWSELPKDFLDMRADMEEALEFYDIPEMKAQVDDFIETIKPYYKKPEAKKTSTKRPAPKKENKPKKIDYGKPSDLIISDAGGLVMVSTKKHETNGDYTNIAGIDRNNGNIKWYVKESNLTDVLIKDIIDYAEKIQIKKSAKKTTPKKETKPKSTPKNKPTTKAKAKTSTKKTTSKKTATKKVAKTDVEHYNKMFLLLRRFKNFIAKDKVTFRQARLIYMAFNKSAVDRKVRKANPSADLFKKANDAITKLFKSAEDNYEQAQKYGIEIEIKDESKYQDIIDFANSRQVNISVRLLKRYISMQGTKPEIAKVNRLIKAIDNAIKKDRLEKNNRLYAQVTKAKKELQEYLKNQDEPVDVTAHGLSKPK